MSSRFPCVAVGRIRRGTKLGGLLGVETARVYASKLRTWPGPRTPGLPPASGGDWRWPSAWPRIHEEPLAASGEGSYYDD
jgi:hypothetical protein